MNPFERVQKLVALATNAGAPIDEQRNAALSAVKLIVEHKMLDERAVPPPPPIMGNPFAGGMFSALFAGLTADVILRSATDIATTAGAAEIMTLKREKFVLEQKNAVLQRELDRLHADRVGTAPKPHRERRRKR